MVTGPVSAGNILRSSVRLFFGNLGSYLSISFLVHSPGIVAVIVLPGLGLAEFQQVFDLYGFVSWLLLTPIASAALTFGVFRQLRGERVTVPDCLRVGFARWLPVLGASILAAVAMFGGFLFCIVPGIFIACGLFVAIPALVVERGSPVAALRRSWQLTEDNRWDTFVILLLLGVIAWVAAAVPRLLLGVRLQSVPTELSALVIFDLVVGVVLSTLQAVAAVVAYYDLRSFKEGLGADELAAIFD